jgi:hypothetical protein
VAAVVVEEVQYGVPLSGVGWMQVDGRFVWVRQDNGSEEEPMHVGADRGAPVDGEVG